MTAEDINILPCALDPCFWSRFLLMHILGPADDDSRLGSLSCAWVPGRKSGLLTSASPWQAHCGFGGYKPAVGIFLMFSFESLYPSLFLSLLHITWKWTNLKKKSAKLLRLLRSQNLSDAWHLLSFKLVRSSRIGEENRPVSYSTGNDNEQHFEK